METLIKFIGAQLTRQLRPVLAHGDLLREFDVVEKLPSDFRAGLLQDEQIILYPKSRLTCPADPFGWLLSTKPAMEDTDLSERETSHLHSIKHRTRNTMTATPRTARRVETARPTKMEPGSPPPPPPPPPPRRPPFLRSEDEEDDGRDIVRRIPSSKDSAAPLS